jgi:putative lipoic acid-binding regulatory protein
VSPCKSIDSYLSDHFIMVHLSFTTSLALELAVLLLSSPSTTQAWLSKPISRSSNHQMLHSLSRRRSTVVAMSASKAGTFFNPVPEDDGDESNDITSKGPIKEQDAFDIDMEDLLRRRKAVPPKASEPSTINGIPTSAGQGFGNNKTKPPAPQNFVPKSKPFVAIGPPLNDVTKPEVDDQGYTLYADEDTGKKSRVFEALVEYPCNFTMKIIGRNEGLFVQEMVAVVAESCQVEADSIQHSVKVIGKWTSVTVHAPVKSADMLYELYETVDRDPRVKFKF